MSYEPPKICEYELARADLLHDVQDKLVHAFKEAIDLDGVSVTLLADRLGKHKSFVSRRLKSPHNMTLETLSDFATALGCYVDVEIRPENAPEYKSSNWYVTKPTKMKQNETVSVKAGKKDLYVLSSGS
ncbi:hypothetical protein HED22_15795 [Thalassospira sp. HF15]|uniref:helix-turn-helix domain-containing protein n=1 Tax=Thalassospira sp. HF15 TaxID=2722755 RepID=UPI001430DDF7|nr:helix-turn-helix transcriptional regulator [Thalassospira sp. HF15]NIY77116.1 hypothetical protein [Thalassospira sp. HF15]